MTPEVPLSFYLRDYPLALRWVFPFGGPIKGSLQRIWGIAVLLPESFPRSIIGVAPSAPHGEQHPARGISPAIHKS